MGVINNGELLVVDDKQALMHKLGKRHLIIEMDKPLAALPPALAGWNLELAADGTRLIFNYDPSRADTGIDELLQAVRAAGVSIKDLQTKKTSLEEIFVNLVKAGK